MIDRQQVWHVIDAQRSALSDLLATLTADDWQHPSLCAGWTVRDVAAHLTLQELGFGGVLAMLAHWRGSGPCRQSGRWPGSG